MYKSIIAVGIAAATCLLAGCGSTGEETAAAAVTKAQFIKQAETICSKARDEVQAAAAAWQDANGKSLDFDTAFTQIFGPTLKQEAQELRSLTAPEEDRAKVARMISNLSEGANGFVADGSKSNSAPEFEAFLREAEAYGLRTCRI